MEPFVDRPQGLRESAVRGVLWIGASQAARNVIQVALVAMLSRLLTADEFGLFGMAAVFVDLFVLVSSFGIGTAMIGRRQLNHGESSSLFWWSLVLGAGFALGTLIVAPSIATLYGDQRLGPVIRLLALAFLFAPLGTVSMSVLEARLNFRRAGAVETVAVSLAGLGSLVLAWLGWGVLSLVWLTVGTLGFRGVLGCMAARWLPGLHFRRSDVMESARYGLNVTIQHGFYYVTRSIDAYMIGRFVGSVALGYYRLALFLAVHPILHIAAVVWRVMFPILASMRQAPEQFRLTYVRVVSCVALVTFASLTLFFVNASEVVRLMLGPQWEPVVPLARVLCFLGLFQSTLATTEMVFLAQGRTEVLVWLNACLLPLTAGALWIGVTWGGVNGVALALVVVTAMTWPAIHRVTGRQLGLSMSEFIYALAWPVAGAVGVGVGSLVGRVAVGGGESVEGLRLIVGLLGGSAGGVTVLVAGRARVLEDLLEGCQELLMGGAGKASNL
jgi:O-antigen/teichoic acid export membrane protein